MRSICAHGSDFRADDGLGGFGGSDRGCGIVRKDWYTQDVVLAWTALGLQLWHVGKVDGGGVAARKEGWGCVEKAG